MKVIYLLIIFNCSTIFSQINSGKITYKAFFSESEATEELKTKNRERYQTVLDEEMMASKLSFSLDFNKNESLFYLSNHLISDFENPDTKKFVIARFYGFDKIYVNLEKDVLIEELYYSFGNILKNKKASFIKWELTDEKKYINNYLCYKATYTYIQKWKGKEFPWQVVAWYCPDISLQFGPIRYNGLPGLILELHEKNIGYIVDKIEFFKDQKIIIIPSNGELLNDEEINSRNQKEKEEILNNK